MLNIITALPCEAKPLIKHYRLNGRQAENGFRIYEDEQLRLIIAGIGKTAAAAACAYLQGLDSHHKHAWLNLGIAGHRELAIGEAVMAHKITDTSTGMSWYPAMPFKTPCQTAALLSLDRPNTDYNCDNVYDMEAAGFYSTAIRFNSSELVQVLKIISDNHTNPAGQVSAAQVEQIITAQLTCIDKLIQQLVELTSQQQSAPDISQFQQRWHFSVSQQHQLQRLLQRWLAHGENKIDPIELGECKNSKTVIQTLKQRIDKLPLRFD